MQDEITLETIAKSIEAMRAEMATKTKLESGLAVIRSEMAIMKAEMVTKTELASNLASIRAEMATKADLDALKAVMVTKTDLNEGLEDLARKVNDGFDEIKELISDHEHRIGITETRLGIAHA
jgi:hypothetical protein